MKKRRLVLRNPFENLPPRGQIVRTCHTVARCVPEICASHDLGHGQVLHGLPLINFRISVPGVIQDPGRLALRERPEGLHTYLVAEPVEWSAGGGHMITTAELVLMCNHIHDWV